ncbi:hypothetical protein [Pelagicoccus sp. SDUM812005]|uniref:hypothetical protein n=1 Tax=Pelagicoccus sp. SDUM812005 TaxID=3041257 RepID=UPI00280C8895|nr:hypothetical protein [Pelagicoccus sp. SDUM812005]MDQ8179228.1 hypothetical protein [Pelagicoccus sp. SDUM812005]
MAERRSRNENLNARAIEQGIPVSQPMVSTESEDVEAIEMKPAFEMEEFAPARVSENEIQEEVAEPLIEKVDTTSTFDGEEGLEAESLPETSSYFDDLDAGEDTGSIEASIEEPALEASSGQDFAEAKEEAALPSYFESLDDAEAEVPAAIEAEASSSEPSALEEEEAGLDISEAVEADAMFTNSEREEESGSPASYFGNLEESVFEEPGPVLEENDTAPSADLEPEIAEQASIADDGFSSGPPLQPAALEDTTNAEENSLAEESELESDSELVAAESLETAESAPAEEMAEEPADSLKSEDLIEQSESLLADAPEPIADAEVIMAAEELVDRIGPVVDIQSLPKTQPSRVLSKTAKAMAEEPEAKPSAAQPEAEKEPQPTPVAKKVEPVPQETQEAAVPPKKKKKKVSLLDSYFKGL